jgi:hypothetical protein
MPVLDIITASVLLLHTRFHLFPLSLVLVLGIYLTLKGLAFALGDFSSRVDLACGVYAVLVGFGQFSNGVNAVASLIIFAWLMQKAVFALIPMQ